MVDDQDDVGTERSLQVDQVFPGGQVGVDDAWKRDRQEGIGMDDAVSIKIKKCLKMVTQCLKIV